MSECVITAEQAKQYGRVLLDRLNAADADDDDE
jgi:hypothetical protein